MRILGVKDYGSNAGLGWQPPYSLKKIPSTGANFKYLVAPSVSCSFDVNFEITGDYKIEVDSSKGGHFSPARNTNPLPREAGGDYAQLECKKSDGQCSCVKSPCGQGATAEDKYNSTCKRRPNAGHFHIYAAPISDAAGVGRFACDYSPGESSGTNPFPCRLPSRFPSEIYCCFTVCARVSPKSSDHV